MNCRSLEKWVWEQGVTNLPAAAVAHASGCVGCRTLIEEVRLLDRSVGVTIVPEPSEEYWDAMALRISRRLADPTDRVIELTATTPIWRRVLIRVWAPTAAAALLAVIAAQRPGTVSQAPRYSIQELDARVQSLTKSGQVLSDSRIETSTEAPQHDFRAEIPSLDLTPGVRLQTDSREQSPVPSLPSMSSELAGATDGQTDGVDLAPGGGMTQSAPMTREDSDEVWPDRQVTIVGEVDSNSRTSIADDIRLANQDPFGAYERHMAVAEQGLESVATLSSPGRLLDGPSSPTIRGSERLTPAEQMRRFDEVSELRQLIARLEAVPSSSRAMSQWSQWTTAWFRLGMLTDRTEVIDSAITAVNYFQSNVPVDTAAVSDWQNRKTQLINRRALLGD